MLRGEAMWGSAMMPVLSMVPWGLQEPLPGLGTGRGAALQMLSAVCEVHESPSV